MPVVPIATFHPSPRAVAAATIALSENGRLHSTGGHGSTINEEGSAAGTIAGAIYIHLRLAPLSRVTAEVNIYPSGGSLSGYASARYRLVGASVSFSGTMSIARGTGRYAHARATGLRFSGTIKRSDDVTDVDVSGELSY
jgi:hypothetical protein